MKTGTINALAIAAATATIGVRFGSSSVLWVAAAQCVMAWRISARPAAEDVHPTALPWLLAGSVAASGLSAVPYGALPAAIAVGACAAVLYAIGGAVHVMARRRGRQSDLAHPTP
jgi:hypothetical protein